MRLPIWYLLPIMGCSTTPSSPVRFIGHGGMGDKVALPANSTRSLKEALEYGLDGIELDVQLTADSILVAYHEQDLFHRTACSGLVNSLTWEQLRSCPPKGNDGEAHPFVRLDSLLPALAIQFPGSDYTLDCKLFTQGDWWPYVERFTRAVARLDAHHQINGRLLVECQVDPFLLQLQRIAPAIPLYRYSNDAEEAIWRAATSHFQGIVVAQDRITKDQVALAQGLGLQVTLFGVGGRVSQWRALYKHPDRVQTDAPDLAPTARGKNMAP